MSVMYNPVPHRCRPHPACAAGCPACQEMGYKLRTGNERGRERERERERERLLDFAVAEPSPGPMRGTGDTPCVKRARLSKSCE